MKLLDDNNIIIQKSFIKNSNSSDWVRFSNEFFNDFLIENDSFIDIPINALRVIFNIISIVSNEQFRPEDRPRQLSLFEEEFETDNNIFARFTIKNSKISPSRTPRQIINAFEFLVKFKMDWYISENSKGEKIRSFGGLITNPSYNERGKTSFLVSSYWLKKIVVISQYNRVLFNLVYNIKNNKHILFALWLKKLPKEGTEIRLETLNKKFKLNYKKTGDFCSKFLRNTRKMLDKYSDISFNYSYKSNKILIIPFYVKKVDDDSISENTKSLISKNQRIRYFIVRHKLDKSVASLFISEYQNLPRSRVLIEEAYSKFIKFCRKNKIKATVYENKEFLEQIQKFLIASYEKTPTGKMFPNSHPRIL